MIPVLTADAFLEKALPGRANSQDQQQYLQAASAIIADVQQGGDEAVRSYIDKFDGTPPKQFLVTEEERQAAWDKVDNQVIRSLQRAADNIRDFHRKQLSNSRIMQADGDVMAGQLYQPIERVGIYVPGGTAVYPSSVLMNAIPAVLAGVSEANMVTPVKDGEEIAPILAVAADIAGVNHIYRVGGVQAIAALAYGTESIPKVDKIVGPGNAYVAAAKKLVYGDVGIDMIAGPSEVAIIADQTSNPVYIAADLIAQAEHDVNARAFLITTSAPLVAKVQSELEVQCSQLPRKSIASASLTQKGACVIVETLEEAFQLSNQIAPEHLEIQVADPLASLGNVRHAGSVFLGEYTPEALGDYYAGPNHVLPTSGTARFSSGLSVDDFVKKTTYLYYSKQALKQAGNDVVTIANQEELEGHGIAVTKRLEDE
ncbi:histidinol dehydrogenase [Gracilibacillus caseinilyticus]|uniref:Histidinol dehydrogenase n=1 Tax=Gracilibacillus caseinilyticus TaxID=2932256 RepID=A0ABY4EV39_9BACI|nr:histidinol dehydrogenase [Gracilibacillus caseinilyticus]UOQ47712.1 histidinol dehydrogenase [Gracilibacillus caseinilyticus]